MVRACRSRRCSPSSVIGGAAGGWAGMLVWRHKTQHAIFWAAQVIGTVVIAVALWLA